MPGKAFAAWWCIEFSVSPKCVRIPKADLLIGGIAMRLACILILAAATSGGCANPHGSNELGASGINMREEVFAWRRGDPRYVYGGSGKTTAAIRKPSVVDQQALLRVTQSGEVQIVAQCWIANGNFVNCHRLETSPDSSQVKQAASRLLREFVIDQRTPAGIPTPNFAMINIWIAKEGVSLGTSGKCILLMCGVPTPPPPPPPKKI
jgi:hypothetical protein